MPPIIDKTKCAACGTCAVICPMQVFRFKEGDATPRVAFGYECWHCNACVLDCRHGALRLRLPLSSLMMHTDAQRLRKG